MEVSILETTLRDGSYEIDFQFTPEDTAMLVGALEQAGLKYIELCHGCGVGLDHWKVSYPKPTARFDDEAHLVAARAVVKNAKLGVLMVIGADFTPIGDLDLLVRHGISFVRLGVLPSNILDPSCLAYVSRAKELGLTTSVNLMQTYGMTPKETAAASVAVAERGADWFYVVDSAGGMTPAEVGQYVRAVREACGLEVGLHAHNNTGMALANCFAAIEAGATLVDGTLQGIGRATGNPPTEQLALMLERMGHPAHVDLQALLRLGDLARPMFAERGSDPTHFVSGSVRVHSRNVAPVLRAAAQAQKSPRDVLHRVGLAAQQQGLVAADSLPPALIGAACDQSASSAPTRAPEAVVGVVARGIERDMRWDLAGLCDDLFVRSSKHRKPSVLHLVPAALFPYEHPLPWENGDILGVTCAASLVTRQDHPPGDRRPASILLDDGLESAGFTGLAPVALQHSFAAWVADAMLDLILASSPDGASAVWMPHCDDPVGERIRSQIPQRRLRPSGVPARPRTLVTAAHNLAGLVQLVERDDLVLVYGVAPDLRASVDAARNRGGQVMRPLLGSAIAARAASLLHTRRAFAGAAAVTAGQHRIVDIFAPGKDDVVVDSVALPTRVLDSGIGQTASATRAVAQVRADQLVNGKAIL